MDEQQLAKWKSDIIDVGFAAKRFRALVYVVRRILWPFVRPYHWYTLDRIAEMANCASATAANAAASAAAANAAAATAASAAAAAAASAAVAAPPAPSGLSEIPNEILRLQTELARLRSEVTAAVNRQLATEAAADRIDDQFARMNDRIDGVEARLTQVADRSVQIDRRT